MCSSSGENVNNTKCLQGNNSKCVETDVVVDYSTLDKLLFLNDFLAFIQEITYPVC